MKMLTFALSGLFLMIIGLLVLYIVDIHEKNKKDKMKDIETGMGNLQYFKHHFRYSIGDVARNQYYISYIILDSSYISSYHVDTSFYEALKFTSATLLDFTNENEISARITESGFAYAFKASDDQNAKLRIEKIINKLNDFNSFNEKNIKVVFHASLYHLSQLDNNCEILLFGLRRNCNRLLGTNKTIILCDTHSMNVIQEEKQVIESILNGLDNNEFKMYLQFIVDTKTRKITSAEALSRWDSSEKGLLTPNKYIEDMEMLGLISRHDFYMFELVCSQLEKWVDTEYKDISISCNFTRITLSEKSFIDELKSIADKYKFDRTKLAIEITEDAIEKDREIAMENVRLCKELGFKIYLDDLGSGYTTLSNLCDYPIDVVKIDRGVLLKTETDRGKDLYKGIIAFAHSLKTVVICEGVETVKQNEFVSDSNCEFIQGWYYSKPMPLEECEAFIKNYSYELQLFNPEL